MEVSVSTFRARLSEWLERARQGEELVVTERGTPIARVLGIGQVAALERLVREGVISPPSRGVRPNAIGRRRARGKPASDLISEQRD